jgi:antitoxin component of RelBE/YafQ-DinJ toxin-antitoxin module
MLKKTITYTDYNGVERTEDFYFNLSKAELMEMEMTTSGGMSETIQRIISAQNIPALITLFKDLILKAYGEKSPDGKRFKKSKELTEEFIQTEAFTVLFMELAANADEASNFVNGIMPVDVSTAIAAKANN